MAIMEPRRPVPFGTIAIHHVVDFVYGLRERLVAWRNRRITRSALTRLSDHELSDIGLTRDEIDSVLDKRDH